MLQTSLFERLDKLQASRGVHSLSDLLGCIEDLRGYMTFRATLHVPLRRAALSIAISGEFEDVVEAEWAIVFRSFQG